MERLISKFNDKIKIITPCDEYHYFFAYYDMRATGEMGINQRHLVHRVSFMDRLQRADDVCEIGYLEDGKFYKIAQTTAWNFQQGAMLQYHPFKENTVYYNECAFGKFRTVTHNFVSGEKSYTDRATACVSPDGRLGLSINFGRIFAFRPGYGYAGFVDEYENVNAPEEDGIFLTDMISGESKLIIRYSDLSEKCGFMADDKILINHISFSPSSDRFIARVRNFPKEGREWWTTTIIGKLDGSFRILFKRSYFSHYRWISDNRLVAHCSVGEDSTNRNLYFVCADDSSYQECFSDEHNTFYRNDIHCTLSPDGKYVIGDGYPDKEGYRNLCAHNLKTGNNGVFLRVRTNKPSVDDIRCDLHARYVFGGKTMSFDTLHNGKREIATFPLDEIDI